MSVRKSSGNANRAQDEVISRVFSAPRALVFEVWTQAEHFARWFGPHGVETYGCELDARPEGVIRFSHRSPDGKAVHLKGTFLEVVQDERIAFTFAFVDEHDRPIPHPMIPDWPPEASVAIIVTLEDEGAGTRVGVSHRITPPAAVSHPAVKHWSDLALQGWGQVFERLADHLSRTTR